MIVGSWVLITINTLIFGFVIFLPQFFLRQGLTIANSLGLHAGACRSPRCSAARSAPDSSDFDRAALEHHRRVDRDHRRSAGSTPASMRRPIRPSC